MPGSIEKEKEKKNNSISKLDIRWFHFKKKKMMMIIIIIRNWQPTQETT